MVYMAIGCVVSVFLVIYESVFLISGKFREDEFFSKIQKNYPDIAGQLEKRISIFKISSKSTIIFVKPNYFQISSKIKNNFLAFFNFIVLFWVLLVRYNTLKKLISIDADSPTYVNLSSTFDGLKILGVVDGINSFFIFFSLFYYSAQSFKTLYKIAIFFVKISKKIFWLIVLLFFGLIVFAVCFFALFS